MRKLLLFAVLFGAGVVARGEESRVRPNSEGRYAAGVLLGKPVRGEPSGVVFKTFEMHVIVGNFPDNTLFSGNALAVYPWFQQAQRVPDGSHRQLGSMLRHGKMLESLRDSRKAKPLTFR